MYKFFKGVKHAAMHLEKYCGEGNQQGRGIADNAHILQM